MGPGNRLLYKLKLFIYIYINIFRVGIFCLNFEFNIIGYL